MLVYAPALLRRRRALLVPAFSAAVLLSFAALLLLPTFHDAPVANSAAMIVAAIVVPFLLALSHGGPIPQRDAFESARLDASNAVVIVARFTESSARRAQRQ